MTYTLIEILTNTLKDAWRSKKISLLMFLVISMAALVIGWMWPKVYVSSAIIEVDEQNILTPLLEGSAVATDIKDYARNATQIISSKLAMDKIITVLHGQAIHLTDRQKESLWNDIKDNSNVDKIGGNLIKISFSSKDPQTAQLVTSNLVDVFISESIEEKSRESENAFKFIADQANLYHKKLLYSENELKVFRSDNLGSNPASSAQVSDRLLDLRRLIEQSNLTINETKIRMKNIDDQISGEAEVSAYLTREGQIQKRITGLQLTLDTLRLTYLDTYPDIIIIKDQIASLRWTIKNASSLEKNKYIRVQGDTLNPLFQELIAKRSKFKTEVVALKSRVNEITQLLSSETYRAKKINNAVVVHAQLTRDYEGNKAVYETLLKKRESARVSMNMDIANQGMTLKIKEPAVTPLNPIGIRFLHIAFFGLLGSLLAPFGLAFVMGNLTGSFKTLASLKEVKGLPVVGRIGTYISPKETSLNLYRLCAIGFCVAIVLCLYGYVGWLKFMGQL
jgi:polysaccharide chain length determinant protein (PEP-CTERM system associated)